MRSGAWSCPVDWSERDNLGAVVDQRANAGMAAVLVGGDDIGLVDDVVYSEGVGTVVTDDHFVAYRPIEGVIVVTLVFEFRNPLRSGTVEEQRYLVVGVVGEFRGRLEAVDEPAEVGVRVRPRQDDDCCGCHCSRDCGPGVEKPMSVVYRVCRSGDDLLAVVVSVFVAATSGLPRERSLDDLRERGVDVNRF